MDTFARVPAPSLVRLHMDPEGPTPGVSASTILADLPDAAIETFLALTGRGLRLDAARRRAPPARRRAGPAGRGRRRAADARRRVRALRGRDRGDPGDGGQQGQADADALVDAMTSYASGRDYLNFAEAQVDVSKSFPEATWQRLKGVRSAVDPDGVLVANHRVPRLYENGLPTR